MQKRKINVIIRMPAVDESKVSNAKFYDKPTQYEHKTSTDPIRRKYSYEHEMNKEENENEQKRTRIRPEGLFTNGFAKVNSMI